MHQNSEWNATMKPGAWREVSVFGDIYSLRKTRSAKERGQFVSDDTGTCFLIGSQFLLFDEGAEFLLRSIRKM